MTDDAELLAQYLERGGEPWNVSLEASWLDYELRAWVKPRLPEKWPCAACNIGIGVGLWDDWLGHELATSITSVDRDPEICRRFRLRQARERHPHPAIVRCFDACTGQLGAGRFDVITIIGSTLAESTDRNALESSALRALAPGGVLLLAEVGNREPPEHVDAVRRLGEIWLAFRALYGAR